MGSIHEEIEVVECLTNSKWSDYEVEDLTETIIRVVFAEVHMQDECSFMLRRYL